MAVKRPGGADPTWNRRTGRFVAQGPEGMAAWGLHHELLDVLPVAALVLDRHGIVMVANRAICELLQLRQSQLIGEPLLSWIGRAGEREAFGRGFMDLRRQDRGARFALDLTLIPALGPSARCNVTATRMHDGHVAITCELATGGESVPEVELGRAIARSLDALTQGVLFVDGQGRVVHTNPAAVKLLGEGLVGRSFLELANPASVEALGRALALGRAGSWHGEIDLLRLDGEPLPVELSLAVGAGDGAPGVVLLRDMRERRRRAFEDRLAAQVDRCLATAFEPREGVMAACAALAHGLGAPRFALLVRTGTSWQRWSLAEAGGATQVVVTEDVAAPEAWSDSWDLQVLDETDSILTAVFGLTADPGPAVRAPLRAPSGLTGQLVLVRGRPEPWDNHDLALVALLSSQIALGLANGLLTLETRALAAYQAMVLDQTSVLLDSVDAGGRVVTWNRASEQLLGVMANDALGRRFGIDVAVARHPEHWTQFWAQLVREGVIAQEITLLGGDGHEVPLHLEGRLLREGGEIRGAVFVGLDLRDRRALERQVLRSQKLAAVGLLAAGIAHEINNPLSGVVGYSHLLLERRDLPQELRQKVEKIAHSGDRCRKIVEGVLLFSRQQDGGTRRKVDLRDLVDRVLAIGEYQWRMHNVRIIREAEESAEVMADADQIEQVMLNLLSNAVEAMPQGGAVHVAVRRRPDGGASLTVADQGEGIPEDIQARIFDPFFSTKEIGKGTGLGLAISYGIVQDHGGDIVVESTPGNGASFTVTLPADGEPPKKAGPGTAPSLPDATAGPTGV